MNKEFFDSFIASFKFFSSTVINDVYIIIHESFAYHLENRTLYRLKIVRASGHDFKK